MRYWDHPHAYGDKPDTETRCVTEVGSSPRVWGQVIVAMATLACGQDHPHAYGDKHQKMTNDQTGKGSSPRVWGQESPYTQISLLNRIIPTRMGTRIILISLLVTTKDHPHAYGDKAVLMGFTVLRTGSSPRVWGQGYYGRKWYYRLRIIPTRMGTSYLTCIVYVAQEDHPHAYGDKYKFPMTEYEEEGSSPRVWGQETIIQISQKGCRIIPTRMGTSIS